MHDLTPGRARWSRTVDPAREDEIALVAEEIARYLAAQPRAADSIEGIRRWWLAPRIGERQGAVVQAALERLRMQGVATQRLLSDGTSVWSAVQPGSTH
jgi:hypothetical protein